jgi:hypothetical protein
MIYMDSKVELDEFEKSAYVARGVEFFRRRRKTIASWNWLKQGRDASPVAKMKKPPDRSGGFAFTCRH